MARFDRVFPTTLQHLNFGSYNVRSKPKQKHNPSHLKWIIDGFIGNKVVVRESAVCQSIMQWLWLCFPVCPAIGPNEFDEERVQNAIYRGLPKQFRTWQQ